MTAIQLNEMYTELWQNLGTMGMKYKVVIMPEVDVLASYGHYGDK